MYSIHWERFPTQLPNVITVQTTFLDSLGASHVHRRIYEEWIGVCTSRLEAVLNKIRSRFPRCHLRVETLGTSKKILPYLRERLSRGKLSYREKPFYKIYTNANHENVGHLLNRYKIAYFERADWLTRLYIDLTFLHGTHSFYYKWYNVLPNSPNLLDAFRMLPDRTDVPDWTVAAFDLETVSLEGLNHVPDGMHPSDRIVMISVYRWNRRETMHRVLYLLPEGITEPIPGYPDRFAKEWDLLVKFHECIQEAHVLTGYNIDQFDLPCLFGRLVELFSRESTPDEPRNLLGNILKDYSSQSVGTDLVVTWRKKIVLDMYTFFKTFSGYDLPSFKLDDVARVKLGGDCKIPIQSTGLWSYYTVRPLPLDVFLEERDVEACHAFLKPRSVRKASDFGTFRLYLDYCLKDAQLVYQLFEKEGALSFLVERANFTQLSATEALHYGNSRYLLELFKTYGTRLGYFINPSFFGRRDPSSSSSSDRSSYQGALNYCVPENVYENVSVMDFSSMYPTTLLSSRLCYGTCAVISAEEWRSNAAAQNLTTLPYRQHSDVDFERSNDADNADAVCFAYPKFDVDRDAWAIVIHPDTEAFLPTLVKHFIEMRRHHQAEWKSTRNIYHYNVQLGIKILVNSLYGVMGSRDSPLAYIDIAKAIVALCRCQLLGAYHYIQRNGYKVCYADTDSLMVQGWPVDNCDEVNAFLSLPYVELNYEQRMNRLLVLSKKRYVYQRQSDDAIVTKGFQKKVNGLTKFMSDAILTAVWDALFVKKDSATPSRGWITWVDVLLQAQYRCRDPKKYSIYRKIKKLDEYKSTSCPAVKFLKKYPDRVDEHVEYTYGRADMSVSESMQWVMDVSDCEWVNYEQLFISQKRIFCMLLNMAFWHVPNPVPLCNMVLNTLRWKQFVQAELKHWHATGRRIRMCVIPGVKYTFSINDYLMKSGKKERKKKTVETGIPNLSDWEQVLSQE